MNIIKKLLAVAMLLSVFMITFAGTTIMDDISVSARVCRDLGFIAGTIEEGVTLEYTASIPTRIQAVRIYLRIFDLEKTAMAYEGKESFLDADKASAEDQKIMAYLKVHPEYGFIGNPDGSFHPNEPMTAQAYYKVLLVALGYDYAKDFSWDTVFDFAKTKEMSKLTAANNKTFTIDKLCIATIEGLKATLKDGSKSLVQSLVEKGIIDSKVIKSGVY
ncbi:MAG: hypothetical protein ACM3TR_03210 [Caulobacteraceae bacterium]